MSPAEVAKLNCSIATDLKHLLASTSDPEAVRHSLLDAYSKLGAVHAHLFWNHLNLSPQHAPNLSPLDFKTNAALACDQLIAILLGANNRLGIVDEPFQLKTCEVANGSFFNTLEWLIEMAPAAGSA